MENKLPDGKRLRAFFKVFIPHMSKDKLGIPSAFTSYMKKKLSQRAVIRNRDGYVWPVKVARIEDDFFFLDGWPKYVQDNSVELGDFLVFQYDGHSVYDVILLGHSGCKKERVGVLEVKNEEESKEVEEEGEWEEKEEEINEFKREEGGGGEEQEEESYSDATEVDVDSNYVEDKEDDSTEEEVEEVEEEKPAKTDKTVGIVDAKSSHKGLKRIKVGMHAVRGEANAVKDEHKGKRPVDPYGSDLFKSGHIPQPKNPYFVTKIRAKRRDELFVPVDVVEDHNLSLPPKIILRDKQGREWTSKLKTWKDGRRWYYGGWGRLCRVNIVGYDDTCVCEFKRRTGGGLYIQVQIVRQGDNAQIPK